MKGWRWKIPASPWLICSSAHLYISRIYFPGGSCIHIRACVRVFVIPTCFMLRSFAFARRDSSGSDDYGGDGRERKREEGTTQESRSPFLIRAFPHSDISGCSRSSLGLVSHPPANLVIPTEPGGIIHRDECLEIDALTCYRE